MIGECLPERGISVFIKLNIYVHYSLTNSKFCWHAECIPMQIYSLHHLPFCMSWKQRRYFSKELQLGHAPHNSLSWYNLITAVFSREIHLLVLRIPDILHIHTFKKKKMEVVFPEFRNWCEILTQTCWSKKKMCVPFILVLVSNSQQRVKYFLTLP